jgi:hypothetical protein
VVENRGIWIAGGTVTAGAMAAGPGATATSTAGGDPVPNVEDIRRMLRDLVQMITANAAVLEDSEQTVTVARLAERESAKEAPDKTRLAALLQLVTAGAGTVSGLAGAVEAIERAVHAVL